MALFKIEKKLEYIKEKPFRLEKEIQELTENNLKTIFGLEFVKSEFALNNFRIDTLAFDKEANAFVIIEYKRDKNFSVIDQGYAYLSLMLNNKADFILEFNENLDKTLKRTDVDWSQSRVLFVSPAFTNYQIEAINFKDLPIELWEVKRFENTTVSYEQIQKAGAQESIKTISRADKTIDNVAKEIKVYSEQEHLENVSEEIKELYEKLKSAIQNLENLEIKPKKKYIAFVAGRNVIDILPQKKALKMWINMSKGELDDSKGITRDVSTTGHWGNGDFEIQIKDDENLEYILSLVKQSIKKNKK
jgi:predicted transport protein|tara:strand:- start:126 stop:1037 length:912 start_codon:yes stop_codon:yes gene_type:complete